jgi:hypothetical protein
MAGSGNRSSGDGTGASRLIQSMSAPDWLETPRKVLGMAALRRNLRHSRSNFSDPKPAVPRGLSENLRQADCVEKLALIAGSAADSISQLIWEIVGDDGTEEGNAGGVVLRVLA